MLVAIAHVQSGNATLRCEADILDLYLSKFVVKTVTEEVDGEDSAAAGNRRRRSRQQRGGPRIAEPLLLTLQQKCDVAASALGMFAMLYGSQFRHDEEQC